MFIAERVLLLQTMGVLEWCNVLFTAEPSINITIHNIASDFCIFNVVQVALHESYVGCNLFWTRAN